MDNRFRKEEFMQYLEETFVCFRGMTGAFLRETVENILEYAEKNMTVSKDQFVQFVADLLPSEISFGEIAMFAGDDMLTRHGIREKQQAIVRFRK